jgi:hypothetical protein
VITARGDTEDQRVDRGFRRAFPMLQHVGFRRALLANE